MGMEIDWRKFSCASKARAIALLVFCAMLSLAVLNACSARNEADSSSPTDDGEAMKGSAWAPAVEADSHEDGVLGDNVLLPEGVSPADYADYVERLEDVELGKTDLGESFKRGRLGVWFSPSCGEARAREVVAECRATWLRGFEMHDGSIDVEVELSEEAEEMEEIGRFEAYPEVRFATLEVVDEMVLGDASAKLVDDAPSNPTRDLVNAGDGQKYHLAAARFYGAWEDTVCDQDVVVAVFDTGKPQGKVDDFGSNVDGSGAYDAVNGWIGGAWVVDSDGHGTAVSGIISAEVGNNKGTDGASHGAVILPVKVAQGGGSTSSWDSVIRGLDHLYSLSEFPDVVNMSFGKHYGADGVTAAAADYARYEVMQEMISDLHEEGVVFVASAGNMDELNPTDVPFYPAACDDVLSIGALATPGDAGLQTILQQGGYPDAQAWQYSITKSDTDLCAYGQGIWVLWPLPADIPGFVLTSVTGTSSAAPQVSSAAALVKAKHPGWDASLMENALKASAVKIADMNGVSRTDAYGYGAINAAAALEWAPPSSGGSASPFTGPSDSVPLTALQAAYQGSLQRTDPDAVPAALERAMQANPDVFGWLHVPGTSVSVPLAARGGDAGFYLSHDSLGNESAIGCAYTTGGAGMSDAVTGLATLSWTVS